LCHRSIHRRRDRIALTSGWRTLHA
jgi:hypothetical protein